MANLPSNSSGQGPVAPSSSSMSAAGSIFLQAASFPSAKLKIEQLFTEWVCKEGSTAVYTLLLESLQSLSLENPNVSYANSISGVNSINGVSPRSLIIKKSPKKRTQSEMSVESLVGGNTSQLPKNNPTAGTMNDVQSNVNSISKSFETNNQINRSATGNISDTTLEDNNVETIDITNSNVNTKVSENNNIAIKSDDATSTIPNPLRRRAAFDTIPAFYTPGKKVSRFARLSSQTDSLSKRLSEIEAFFRPFPHGIPVEKFVHVTKRLCGIPSFFNLPLCKRINELYGDADSGIPQPRTIGRNSRNPSGVKIKLKTFLKFWSAEVEPCDRTERFFRVIKKHDAEYIYKDDFVPFLQELLHFHPGLDFLESHEEFQRKYALTVITRIFYKVNTSRSGKLSLREVRNSNLFNACMHVDEETDINRVMDYFSYEHFYVLYCKFFELDGDKDSKLTRNDLLKYQEHSLSDAIVDRIFQVGTRVFSDGQVGGFASTGMSYPDFIFFMLSEEDKSSEGALKYWFNCCDLDGDQVLNPEEMKHFYRHQIHRVTSLGQESINFQDVLCQMVDMISPKDANSINLADMLKPEKRLISGVLFDILFNLHKFMRFETRDPFQEKIRREDSFQSDWDRYAHIEYNRLAQEEEDGCVYTESTMDVVETMQTQQQQQQQLKDAEIQYQQTLNGFEQLSNWTLSDDDDEDHHHRNNNTNTTSTSKNSNKA